MHTNIQAPDKGSETPLPNPQKETPAKPDKNPDPTKPRPGGNEPNKVDPTRIEEPKRNDPTRIAPSKGRAQARKWTRVNSWAEAMEKMKAQG